MIRTACVVQVNPDANRGYERRHDPIWPELAEVLRAHGMHNHSIFLQPETSQLFGYAEIENAEPRRRIADTAVCRRWWRFMSDIMPGKADHSPVSKDLREVFHSD